MTYGHDRTHASSAHPRAGRAGGWRELDPDHRFALIERALGGPRQAAA